MFVAIAFWLLLFVGCVDLPAAAPDPDCSPPVTFADARQPDAIRHVAAGGDDENGDGSAVRPFASVPRAARGLVPGTAIYIHAGTYAGGLYLSNVRGTGEKPIWIMGAPGERRPILRGGHQGIYLHRPARVVLQDLEVQDTDDNGINVDDGEDLDNEEAARFVVFRRLSVHDTGRRPSGVAGCLKISGVNDVAVLDSDFARCGLSPESGAVGVNGVGVHRGRVSGNRFRENGFGAVQFKGASRDVEIVGNEFRDTGWRAINMGGATGGPFFRPSLATLPLAAEAIRLRVTGNLFVGSEAAAAIVGCVECEFTRNTVVNPEHYVLRVLQETTVQDGRRFEPSGRTVIAGNLFHFRRADLNRGEDINVGAGTDTASMTLSGNAWYAHDRPDASRPLLPTFLGRESGSTIGERPAFADERAADYRLAAGSVVGAPAACLPRN